MQDIRDSRSVPNLLEIEPANRDLAFPPESMEVI